MMNDKKTPLCVCSKAKRGKTDISPDDIKVIYSIAIVCGLACLPFAWVIPAVACGALLIIIIPAFIVRILFGHKLYCSTRYSVIMPLRILKYF